jgi:hypothetical protein
MTDNRDHLIDQLRACLHGYARDETDAVLDRAALKEVAALLDTDRIDSRLRGSAGCCCGAVVSTIPTAAMI